MTRSSDTEAKQPVDKETEILDQTRAAFGCSILAGLDDDRAIEFFRLMKQMYVSASKTPYQTVVRVVKGWGVLDITNENTFMHAVRHAGRKLFGPFSAVKAKAKTQGKLIVTVRPNPSHRPPAVPKSTLTRLARIRGVKEEGERGREDGELEPAEDRQEQCTRDKISTQTFPVPANQPSLPARQPRRSRASSTKTEADADALPKFNPVIETITLALKLKDEFDYWSARSQKNEILDENVIKLAKVYRDALKDTKDLFQELKLMDKKTLDEIRETIHVENLQVLIQNAGNTHNIADMLGKLTTQIRHLATGKLPTTDSVPADSEPQPEYDITTESHEPL